MVLPLFGVVLALLGIAPQEWLERLDRWGQVLWAVRVPLMAALIVLLLVRLALLQRARETNVGLLRRARETNAGTLAEQRPDPYSFHPTDRERLNSMLYQMASSDEPHTVRIMIATGMTMLPVLRDYMERLEAQSEWELRILLLNPRSGHLANAGKDWPAEVRAGTEQLRALHERMRESGKPFKLRWRYYDWPQPVHGLILDTEHVFVGFFGWAAIGDRRELRILNRPFLHLRRQSPEATDQVALFVSWFDYFWESADRPRLR